MGRVGGNGGSSARRPVRTGFVEGRSQRFDTTSIDPQIGMADAGSTADMDALLCGHDQEFDIVDKPEENRQTLDMGVIVRPGANSGARLAVDDLA